jgi:energy-coupling factor transporter ATP-binding protein EcfA2
VEHASAMVLVTHNRELAARADRILRVDEGRLVAIEDFFDAKAERLERLSATGGRTERCQGVPMRCNQCGSTTPSST